MRIYCLLFLSAIVVPGLYGQVFQVNGGTSTLYQAQGGTLSARGAGYDASISAGLVAGQFVGGANLTAMRGKSTYILGSDYIPFVLPTDIFDTSHYLIAVGGGAKANLRNTDILAFAGATSTDFESPFFEGVRAESPAGILFLKKPIAPHLMLFSNMVFSKLTTAISSLQWQPEKELKVALSGGAGSNQPYGAGSVDFKNTWLDMKAAYIEAGSQFHRVVVEAPLMSEPDRENVTVTVTPTHFLSFSGGRNNYLSPVANTQTNVRSAVDDVSGALSVAGTGLSATYYHSSYMGSSNDSTAYTVNRGFIGRINTTSSYLESRPSDGSPVRSFVSNIMEVLTPRLNVSQLVSRSQGQTTVSFGGGLLSNVASISAQYETYYVPERNSNPFEQALILDVQLHLFRGISLHGATFVAPDGSLKYTADTEAVTVRQGGFSLGGPGGARDSGLVNASIGNMLLRGRVVDTEGHPVAGAALKIDDLLVYTNDDGLYYLRERKPHNHQLKVMVDQFLNGGVYRVVSAPETIRSTYDKDEPDTVIVVERVPQRASQGTPGGMPDGVGINVASGAKAP